MASPDHSEIIYHASCAHIIYPHGIASVQNPVNPVKNLALLVITLYFGNSF